MSEETMTTEEMNTTEETETMGQPVGVQAQVVVKYLEEIYGAITMLATNINNQTKQLKELIKHCEVEDVIALLRLQTQYRPTYDVLYAVNFSFWKRRFLQT